MYARKSNQGCLWRCAHDARWRGVLSLGMKTRAWIITFINLRRTSRDPLRKNERVAEEADQRQEKACKTCFMTRLE